MQCPCGQPKNYEQCCGQFIEQGELPNSPEELMRSRYTAYTKGFIEYIEETMKSPASDNFDRESAKRWATSVIWIKLEVIDASQNNDKGTVEFKAYFSTQGNLEVLHERSTFHKIVGKWYYITGFRPSGDGVVGRKVG